VKVTPTNIPDVRIIEPRVFKDDRGYFFETFHAERFGEQSLPHEFVQDNVSFSARNVIRGLHYQLGQPQGKLVMALSGEIFDVAVDIRRDSPTFGRWAGIILSAENARQLYIPEGFAHGFCVLSETARVYYKCTDLYAPKEERGIVWNDPSLQIAWPVASPILSDKDRAYPYLAEVEETDLPSYKTVQ
jgi:dTDP-4-dehydrorhamnose 3,5-epimerase